MSASEIDDYFYKMKFDDYFVDIKRIPLDYQDHKKFYDHYKGDKRYYCEIDKYINDKSLVFDAKDYALMCEMGKYKSDYKDNFKNDPVYIKLSNLEQIYKIHNITERLDIVRDIYCSDNMLPKTKCDGPHVYDNKSVINSIIDRYVHWCSHVGDPYNMGESYFDNSVFCVRGYPSCIYTDEAYIIGKVYLKKCDLYARLKKATLKNFHFYKCNIVVTDLSGITFKDCIFEKCNFVKSNFFNEYCYQLLFDDCNFIRMKPKTKLETGDIKSTLRRKLAGVY